MKVEFGQAILLIIAVVGYGLIQNLVSYLFARVARPSFVTHKHCKSCGQGKTNALKSINQEIADIKGLMLEIAVKMEIPAEKLKHLVRRDAVSDG